MTANALRNGLPELRIAMSNVPVGRLRFLKSGTVLEPWTRRTEKVKEYRTASYPLQMYLETMTGDVPEFAVDGRYPRGLKAKVAKASKASKASKVGGGQGSV